MDPGAGFWTRLPYDLSPIYPYLVCQTRKTLTSLGLAMPEVSLNIPQIGEGLQEARLVAVLKQPGDAIKRDEPIYQMETDKAVMDVESPYEGTLVEWLAEIDELLPIGAPVAKMETSDPVQAEAEEAPAEEVTTEDAAPVAAARNSLVTSGSATNSLHNIDDV